MSTSLQFFLTCQYHFQLVWDAAAPRISDVFTSTCVDIAFIDVCNFDTSKEVKYPDVVVKKCFKI